MAEFSKKAKRKAKVSRMRTEKMLSKAARKSGPVKVSYLPGFGPPSLPPPSPEPASPEPALQNAKFPFWATVNGRKVLVSRNAYGIQFDYPE